MSKCKFFINPKNFADDAKAEIRVMCNFLTHIKSKETLGHLENVYI